jgi:hypothetical protein
VLKHLSNFLNNYEFSGLTVNIYHNEGKTDFGSQLNFGVSKAKSKWVSILEFDDEYASIWFKNVKIYMEAYPEMDAFLPIVVDVDSKGVFAGFTNEATFAASMNTEIGILTNDMLLSYQNFQSSGMVIKKEVEGTVSKMEKCKIALYSCPVDISSTETKVFLTNLF